MKNFLLILAIGILIPIIWFIGVKGKTFPEMIHELGIDRWFARRGEEQ